MKKAKSFWIAMLASVSMIGLSACGDDDDAPSNQIKLNGETIKFTNAYVDSDLNIDDEFGEYSYHMFSLTGDGLTVNDNGTLSGSGDMVRFGLISESLTELEEGTYDLKFNTEVGDAEFFEVYSNFSPSNLDTYYAAYRGKIKVSKSGEDRYTISFDFDVYTSETETEDEEFVSGKIKGNYKGSVEVITGGGGAKQPSGKATQGKKTFSWE